MRIPVYRIQNVLDAFGKHIARAVDRQVADMDHDTETCPSVIHSQAALRQTIIDQFENGVIDRVYSLTRTVPDISGAEAPQWPDPLSRGSAGEEVQVLRYCHVDSEGAKTYRLIDLSRFH